MKLKEVQKEYASYNVLYVEDEREIAQIGVKVLGLFFNHVHSEENGEAGLEYFRQNSKDIDIVITDINMPLMDGIQMCRNIRKINQDVPIVITTAFNENKYLLQAIDIGISGYILKPLNIEELIKTVSKALEPRVLKDRLDEQEKQNKENLLKSAKFSAIGQLAAGLTHEINTPLTYIKGSIEMMCYVMQSLPESNEKTLLEKYFQRADDGVKRIANIVDSMSEVAKKSNEEIKLTNIFQTVVVATIMGYNRSKHITKIYINDEPFNMSIDKNKEVYEAYVQPQRIEQVWIVIINNALDELIKIPDFHDRELKIYIEDEKDYVVVRFEDNAGGIGEDIIENLFEPFKSTKESSGMGVGLSIAKKIVDEQYGNITAYNKDKGAVFEVLLPKIISCTLNKDV